MNSNKIRRGVKLDVINRFANLEEIEPVTRTLLSMTFVRWSAECGENLHVPYGAGDKPEITSNAYLLLTILEQHY